MKAIAGIDTRARIHFPISNLLLLIPLKCGPGGSIDIPFSLNGIERRAIAGSSRIPLRIVLCAGETIRLRRRLASLTVRAGMAWITEGGRDIVLLAGDDKVDIGGARDCPVISAVGPEALLSEI
jgi:hypothetical protein